MAEQINPAELELKENVVHVGRVCKVVKGGKRFSFSAIVTIGDGQGHVGYGLGKAKGVPEAIKKGVEKAKKNLIRIPIVNNTIPHEVTGAFGAGKVVLRPASEGTGVIAGGAVRAVVESAGIRNILTKSLGTANPHNVIKATLEGLLRLRRPAEEGTVKGESPSGESAERKAQGDEGPRQAVEEGEVERKEGGPRDDATE